ncbi:hypothetical protein ACFE04_005424 [Oxalis oulophora]
MSVSICDDNWVDDAFNNKVVINPCTCPIPERVHELIHISGQEWKGELIDLLFSPEQGNVIKAIPLSTVRAEDQWCWMGNAKGVYTVWSGYAVAWQKLFGGDESWAVTKHLRGPLRF